MAIVNLNIQGISSPECIKVITEALNSLGDINNIHVDWESGRAQIVSCLLYTSPSPRDRTRSRMPSSA